MLYTYHIGVKWGNLRSVKCDKHHNINKEDENQRVEWQKDVDPRDPRAKSCIPYLLIYTTFRYFLS